MTSRGFRHWEPLRSKRVDRPVAVAPRVPFGRTALLCSRRIGVRADIGEDRPFPNGIRPQGLVPGRAAPRELLDRRLPLLSEQEVAELADIAKGQRDAL